MTDAKSQNKVEAPSQVEEPAGAVQAANEAAEKATAEHIEALEKLGEVARANHVEDTLVTAGAETFAEEAKKMAEGELKTDDDGFVLGVDGKTRVSNENPDPRCVR